MHTLVKVDGIEDFNSIPLLQKCIATFKNYASLWKRFVKNNMVSIAKITQKKEPILLDSFKVIARLTCDFSVSVLGKNCVLISYVNMPNGE